MKIKIVTNILLALASLILIAFSLQTTLSATYTLTNITKIRQIGENTYVIDSDQNALIFGSITKINNSQANVINTRLEGDNAIPFQALKELTVLKDGTIFLIDGLADGVFEYNGLGEFVSEHTRFQSGSSIVDIISITSDFNDNVYALQAGTNYTILKKDVDDKYFEELHIIDSLALSGLGTSASQSALLACDFEKELFYIASEGSLLKIDGGQASLLCTYEGIATDIAVDYLGNPYLALNNGKILKYENKSLYLDLSVETFCLNFENGDITYIKNSNEITKMPSDFVNNLSKFNHPIDFESLENLTTSAEIYTLNVATSVYKYPLKVSLIEELNEGTNIIKLGNPENYPLYTYILVSYKNALMPCYVLTSTLNKLIDTTLNIQMRTFTTSTRAYKYPSADYIDNSSLYLTTFPENTTLQIVGNACGYSDSQGRTFYEVVHQDKIYYVMESMLTTLSAEEGNLTLKPNNAYSIASIKIYAGANSDSIIGQLPKNAKFYVNTENFDKKSSRTYIEYLDANNNYVCGFVDTKNIKIDEMNPFIIVAIFLILLVLILILILILHFLKERKNKNNETKNKQTSKP